MDRRIHFKDLWRSKMQREICAPQTQTSDSKEPSDILNISEATSQNDINLG